MAEKILLLPIKFLLFTRPGCSRIFLRKILGNVAFFIRIILTAEVCVRIRRIRPARERFLYKLYGEFRSNDTRFEHGLVFDFILLFFFEEKLFNFNSHCFYFAGAAAASRLYVDAISKLAKQAQQGTWGGSSDIGKRKFSN